MTLGQRIKQARNNAHLSQKELAEMIGVSQQSVAQYETDKGRPTTNNLKKIASVLGKPDLLTLDWDDVIIDVPDDQDKIHNEEQSSFEAFLKSHGAAIYCRCDEKNGFNKSYYISINGKTYVMDVEIWERLHNHLYEMCQVYIKGLADLCNRTEHHTKGIGGAPGEISSD